MKGSVTFLRNLLVENAKIGYNYKLREAGKLKKVLLLS